MQTEIWKPIIEFPGYEVSNYGRIKSFRKHQFGHLLHPRHNPKGYLRIKLRQNGEDRTIFVHRIVAKTFLGCLAEKNQINHKNGVKDDNRVDNLEWCTGSENLFHAYNFLGRKSATQDKHLPEETRKKISEANRGKIRSAETNLKNSLAHIGHGLLGENPNARQTMCIETGKIFSCAKEAAIYYGLKMSSIYHACLKGAAYRGLHFQYLTEGILT